MAPLDCYYCPPPPSSLPLGAVGSRPMPWTRLCCSELHWCIPVVLPVGQPGAPASSIRLPTWFVSWWMDCGDSAACPILWVSGITDLVSLQSSSVHTAMHCRSFRDNDILKCPERFCSLYISRTYTKESYVAEDSTGMVELEDTTILPFGACLLSECGVIAIWLHPTCTTTMFFACLSALRVLPRSFAG